MQRRFVVGLAALVATATPALAAQRSFITTATRPLAAR